MNKISIGLFMLLALTFSACKKSSSSPTIVGSWQLSGITGTYATQSSAAAPMFTTSYAYSGPTLTETDTTSVAQVTVNTETWNFNNDGTYSIYESYRNSAAAKTTIDTVTGWWDYTSSTTANSCIVFRNWAPSIVPTGGAFMVKSVNGNQLVLTVNESNVANTYGSTIRNFTLTFTK